MTHFESMDPLCRYVLCTCAMCMCHMCCVCRSPAIARAPHKVCPACPSPHGGRLPRTLTAVRSRVFHTPLTVNGTSPCVVLAKSAYCELPFALPRALLPAVLPAVPCALLCAVVCRLLTIPPHRARSLHASRRGCTGRALYRGRLPSQPDCLHRRERDVRLPGLVGLGNGPVLGVLREQHGQCSRSGRHGSTEPPCHQWTSGGCGVGLSDGWPALLTGNDDPLTGGGGVGVHSVAAAAPGRDARA